jgi:hypothetical protein
MTIAKLPRFPPSHRLDHPPDGSRHRALRPTPTISTVPCCVMRPILRFPLTMRPRDPSFNIICVRRVVRPWLYSHWFMLRWKFA